MALGEEKDGRHDTLITKMEKIRKERDLSSMLTSEESKTNLNLHARLVEIGEGANTRCIPSG